MDDKVIKEYSKKMILGFKGMKINCIKIKAPCNWKRKQKDKDKNKIKRKWNILITICVQEKDLFLPRKSLNMGFSRKITFLFFLKP